jgi:hypothetical protein
MKKHTRSFFVSVACLAFSLIVGFAQTASGANGLLKSDSTLSTIITSVIGIFNQLIPVIIGAAVVVFIYG